MDDGEPSGGKKPKLDLESIVQQNVESLKNHGCLNYYGLQETNQTKSLIVQDVASKIAIHHLNG